MPRNIHTVSVIKVSFATTIFASILLLSPALQAQQPDPSPIPAPSQPPPASPNAPAAPATPATPSSGASPSAHMMRTWRRLNYTCDGDAKVVVNLHAKEARVTFKGHTYNMKQLDESEGQKYTSGSLVWRIKDEVATLENSAKSGENKSLAAGCHLQSAGTAAPPAPSAKTPPSNP
jgi:membrane-bound inhibitor of C-type lysozyme